MAITIQEKPYSFTKVGQKLIYRTTSTNVANTGFRFVVKMYEGTTNLISTVYVVPTPEATPQGVFDISCVIRPRIETKIDLSNNEPTVDFQSNTYPVYLYKIVVMEGYDVAGVFTEQSGTAITNYHYFFPCSHNHMDGYRPNPDTRYGLDGVTKLLMGDRNSGTHIPRILPSGTTASSSTVFIPVRNTNLDGGYLYYLTDYEDTLTAKDSGLSTATSVRMKLVESNGTNHFETAIIEGNGIVAIPAYPKTLEGTTQLINPSDYPNYRYYSIMVVDSVGTQLSAEYIFYPEEIDCTYENVRLAWWSPVSGGYDYFNFSKKNEQSIEVERKRVQRVVGNYSTASSGFGFDSADRGLMEGDIETRTYITMTSDYIRENEFALLKNLIRSKDVYIITDGQEAIPIVIEENAYTDRRTRDAKVYQLTLKARYSNESL